MKVKCLKIGKLGLIPSYATSGSVGLDLTAAVADQVFLKPGARMAVPTGIALDIPENYEGQIRPRSGLAKFQGLTVLNSVGTVDNDFKGEIEVILINLGQHDVQIVPNQRIAQLVICPIIKALLVEVDDLDDLSSRQGKGFGSTGA